MPVLGHSASSKMAVAVSIGAMTLSACVASNHDDDERLGTATSGLTPDQDPFYVPPANWQLTTPGTILRSRSVFIPMALLSTNTQMLVRSTDAKGQPTTVVSTLMVPWAGLANRPLVSYQPAINSLGDQCNPSYTLQTGGFLLESSMVSSLLNKKWAVVVTDYQGAANAFSAGRMAGNGTLDGIRAAERLTGSGLSVNTSVGLWGYSGGGQASAWAAQLHPSYAPELKIKGVAAGGVPADAKALAYYLDGGSAAGTFLLGAVGLTRQYPEMIPALNAAGNAMRQAIGDKCVLDAYLSYPNRHLNEFTVAPDPLETAILQPIFADNKLGGIKPTAPVFLYHSVVDDLVPFEPTHEARNQWCSMGATVQWVASSTGSHLAMASNSSSAAVGYLTDRFNGVAAPNNCSAP